MPTEACPYGRRTPGSRVSKGSIVATSSNAAVFNEPIVGMPYMPAKAAVSPLAT